MSDSPHYQPTTTAANVLRYLQDCGYKVGKSQFYEDIKSGRLKRDDKGYFTKRLVNKYARTLKRVSTGKTEKEENMDLAQIKLEEEIRKLRLHNKQSEFQMAVERGKYILREDFERELAARLILLDSGLERYVRDNIQKFIHLVAGDTAHADLLEQELVDGKNELLNNYATTKQFEVLVLPEPGGRDQDATTEEETDE